MKESLHRLTAVPLPFQGRLICQRRKKIKVAHLHKKTLEYQHYQYRQGQPPALASPRRTARYERISPDGFDMAALEVTLYGGTPPPPNGGSPPLSGEAILPKNKPAPTEVPVGAGFAASEQFHLFRYSRFTFSYACSLPRLPLPVQCLPE